MIIDSRIIEYQGMPLFQKARLKPPADMQGNFSEFACFFYMVEGSMTSFSAHGTHTAHAKEAVLSNCGNYIKRYMPSQDEEECEAIAVYLYPQLLKTIYKDEVPDFLADAGFDSPRHLIGNKLLEQYMNTLSLFFQEPDAVDDALGILKLKELVMILLRSENHASVRKLLSDVFTPTHVAFKEAVQRNLYNPISLEQLAFLCNMSLSTFKRQFKKVFDATPAKYIKHKRLERAASQLTLSSDAIADIAYDCGFQDASTFSSVFHEKYGVAPRTYRLTQTAK